MTTLLGPDLLFIGRGPIIRELVLFAQCQDCQWEGYVNTFNRVCRVCGGADLVFIEEKEQPF